MRSEDHKPSKRIGDAAIRSQVEKIIQSERFAGSPKLGQLLTFLVNEMLAGHPLNEYSIAMDVFEKDDSFDPRIDPLVRVHVSRLRTKLNEYRATAGLHDAIEIELPSRTYAPRARMRSALIPTGESGAVTGLQNIAVRPFRSLSSDEPGEYFCEGLLEELIHAMAKVKTLRIIPLETLVGTTNTSLNLRGLCEQLRVEAILCGNVRKEGCRVRMAIQLTNATDGSLIWSEIYERQIDDLLVPRIFTIQEEIASTVVRALWIGKPAELPSEQVHGNDKHLDSSDLPIRLAEAAAR